MTENSSKGFTGMLEEYFDTPGAFAPATIDQFGLWIDEWSAYGGDTGALDGTSMVVNTGNRSYQIWVKGILHV